MKTKYLNTAFCGPLQKMHDAGRCLTWIAFLGLLLWAAKPLQAQTTTNLWIGSNTVWGTSANWSPANVPNYVDTMVTFNNTTNSIVNSGSTSGPFTIGTFNLTATSGTIGLAGANLVINLQASSGTPIINCSGGAGLYWYFTTTGTQGFTKLGNGTLTSRFASTVNTITGPIIIGGGGLALQTAAQIASASSLTISNAAGGGLNLQNSANGSATGFGNIYTVLPATLPIYFQGGGAPVIQSSYVGQTMTILGNVLGTSGSALTYKGPGTTILAGTNYFVGNSTNTGGTIDFSTTTTNAGTLTVSANATNGVIATSPGSSMVVSNLTLIGTNNSVLAFNPGWSGTMPTAPMLNVTNLLTFVTNVPAPLYLAGGGWRTNSYIPLLQYGALANTNPNGVFASFALGALPQGINATLVDGTSSNQIGVNISSIVPLVWNPATVATNWATTNNNSINFKVWSLNGTPGQSYNETNGCFGPAVEFDDLPALGVANLRVTNNSILSPNSVTFNITNNNYTLLGSGGIANNANLTLNGSSYLTNSLANTYFGNTVLNGGVMVLNNAAALGYGGPISFNGGTLQFSANNTVDYSSRFSSAANQAYSFNLGGRTVSFTNGLTSSGGSLTVRGAGTLTLKAASSYTGATTNAAGTLKLGIANAIPTSSALTLGSSGNTATLDLAGFNQQLSGLTMDSASSSPVTVTNSSTVNPAILTFNGGTSTYAGSIVDGVAAGAKSVSLTVTSGSLTLTGVNTYTNTTMITNGGALFIGLGGSITSTNVTVANGSLFDVSAISYATSPGGSLNGIGNVNGSVEIAGLSAVQPDALGASANHGTLTFSNNLTLDQASVVSLNVATTAASANNDHIIVLGQLNANDANGNTVNIQGPAAPANLDTATDYTLISSPNTTINGSFNAVPNWIGVKPANYAHYTVVTSANTVKLHYSVGVLLSGAGAVSPTSGLHQKYVFTVLVTPGTGSTGIGVTADFSGIGGSAQTFTGVGNLFSFTNAVPGSVVPGTYAVPFTVTDAQLDTFSGYINVTIADGTLVWAGTAGNNNWSSLNWLNGAVPDASGDAGDALLFAGTTRLAPVMDNSYNVSAVTFSNNAGAFNITTSGNALTLAAGGTVENDSLATESLDVPINLTAGSQFNTPAGNLIVGALGGSSDGFTKSGSGRLTIDGTAGLSSYSGTTTNGGGTLAISNADDVLPTGTTIAYTAPATLDLGGNSQSVANLNLSNLSAGTATVANGNLTVTAGTLNFSPNVADTAVTTLDLSGLNNFTYPAGTIYFYGAVAANSTVKLAQTNSIKANAIYVANGGLTAAAPSDTATLLLGQSNIIYTGTIQLGGYHNAASAVAFNTGFNNPTLTLRGLSGAGSSVVTFNVGVNNNGNFPSANFDARAGSVDAVVNNLYVVNNNSGGGYATLSLSNGTLNAGNIFMNYDNGSTTSGTTATINQNGGTVLVGNLDLSANASSGLPAATSIYNLGNGTNGSGLLSANMIQFGNTAAPGTSSQTTLNFINGTIENYDPALGQPDTIGSPPAFGFSSQQNLDISGLAGGGAANNYQTLNIVLSAAGTHNFYAETNYTITEESSVLISGSGGLTANGPGLVTLNGTNTYTGNTTVSAGTLEIVEPTIATLSTVSVSNGAVLKLDFAVTNQIAQLVINGVSKAPGVYNNSTDPAYITNTGSLLVVPLSTNAYLTSLALNPTDYLTPVFATNVFAYYATNDFGTNLTVTVVNGNLFASNKLFLNGLAIQSLTSSVPSITLTNFGVGSTNVIKVLVTAQDGVTTNLYTVNLTELPAVTINTNTFTINNAISGNNLNLSWPPDRLGWRLQVQTNALNAGLGNTWYSWPGSTTVTNVSIPLNPANPTVFLRMIYP